MLVSGRGSDDTDGVDKKKDMASLALKGEALTCCSAH
jgi:hypothetical protein